jgi:hypothetical protein
VLRSAAGHPGVAGARWSPQSLTTVADEAQPGNRLLRLEARTDGTPAGTVQAQACHRRVALHGTYAARVRFSDTPAAGADGDPVVQAFFAAGPLRHDFDPAFSEIDWEYLANGGWGSPHTRLYAIAWQTVRLEPWQAHNAAQELMGSHAGWRILVMQVDAAGSRWFLDGREVARHGGRNTPVEPMALAFSVWFSPAGLLPAGRERRWHMDVDWVLHLPDAVRSPAAVGSLVAGLRARGVARRDTVADRGLPSRCDF